MRKQEWLLLLRRRELTCHLCGLLILSRKELTGDHFPVPRSKGGKETRPAHAWCDHAHEDRSYIHATDLERLILVWKSHKKKFNNRAYNSLRALKQMEKE